MQFVIPRARSRMDRHPQGAIVPVGDLFEVPTLGYASLGMTGADIWDVACAKQG